MQLTAASVAAVVLAACSQGSQPPVANGLTLADSAEQVLFDVRTLMTQSGVQRGQLFADTVFVFDDQTRFVLRGVHATFNTELGEPNGKLKGDRGIYSLRTRILDGFGNVVVTSTEGKRLTSNHLRYSEKANEISSDSAYTYTEPDGTIQRGIGFRSDPNLTVVRCLRACGGEGDTPLGGIPDRT